MDTIIRPDNKLQRLTPFDLFDNFFEPFRSRSINYPRTNIYYDDETQTQNIQVAVPGFTRDDLSIEVQDDQLVIKGDHSNNTETNHFKEQFVKRLSIENVDIDNIDANLENGILNLKLPLTRGPTIEKKIPIK